MAEKSFTMKLDNGNTVTAEADSKGNLTLRATDPKGKVIAHTTLYTDSTGVTRTGTPPRTG